MQCQACQHVTQGVAPNFCSHCGGRFPPTPAAQAPVDTNLSLTPEMETGIVGEASSDAPKELSADVPSCPKKVKVNLPHPARPMGKSANPSTPVPSQSGSPSAGVQKKKKNKKRKKKKFNSEQAESESLKSVNSLEEISLDSDTSSVLCGSLTYLGPEAGSKELGGDHQDANDGNEHRDKGENLLPESVLNNSSHSETAKTNPASPVEQPTIINPPLPVPLSPDNSDLMAGDYEKRHAKEGPTAKELSAVLLTESSTDGKGAGDQFSVLAQKQKENPGRHPTADPGLAPMSVGKVADGKEIQKQNCSPEDFPSAQVEPKVEMPECASEASSANAIQDPACNSEMLKSGHEINTGMTGGEANSIKDDKTKETGLQLPIRTEKEINSETGKEKESLQPDHMEVEKNLINLINHKETLLDTQSNSGNAKADTGKPKTQPSTGKGEGLPAGLGKGDQKRLNNEKGDKSTSGKESGGSSQDQSNSRKGKMTKEKTKNKKGDQTNSEKGTDDQASSEKTHEVKLKDQDSQKSASDPKMLKDVPENQGAAKSTPVKSQPNKNQHESYSRPMHPDDIINVYFHVIISNDFKLDVDKHKVVIKAGRLPGFSPWEQNICEMNFSKNLGVHGMLFEGFLSVPKENMKQKIPYKYCVLRGKKHEYEFIYKPNVPDGIFVNRCLFIPAIYIKEGEWHQYDDIACVKPDKKWIDRLKTLVGWDAKKEDVVAGKKIAGEIMLGELFSILIPLNSNHLKSFLIQLNQFCIVARDQRVDQNGPTQWTTLPFGQKEVNELVMIQLRKVAQPFLNLNDGSTMLENAVIKDRLAAGLLCLAVGQIYNLASSVDQLRNLCQLLCLEKMTREQAKAKLESIKEVFSAHKPMKECLTKLCLQCIDAKAEQWIWIIPVLHFFSSSFDVDNLLSKSACLQPEDIWAGLEGVPFHDFEKYAVEKKLLSVMKNKLHLLELDRTLVRSWFSLLSLENLVEFLNQVPINPVDALAGTYYKLMKTEIRYMNHKHVEDLLRKLLQIISLPENRACQLEAQEFCLMAILKMYDIICKNTNELRFCNVPALSGSIFFKISRIMPKEVDSSCKPVSEKLRMDDIFQEVLKITRNLFRKLFRRDLPVYIEWELELELQVWNRFVSINVSDEQLADFWKNSLLGDLEGRIKQERPFTQIEIYCKYHRLFEKFHSSIASCFERCAVEAVQPVCQSRGNILERLWAYDVQPLGRLLSTVIKKSWPTSSDGTLVEDFDGVLKHLNTWLDFKHILKLYGTNGELLVNLADDAKALLNLADSVFLDVFENLVYGTLLVKHLECILQNEAQFLSICKLKQCHVSGMKGNQDSQMKKILSWRKEELKSLKQEREFVDSLLKMCRNVRETVKVATDEVEAIHNSDLDIKHLYHVVEVRLPDFPDVPNVVTVTYYKLSQNVKEMAEQFYKYKDSYIFGLCWNSQAQAIVDEGDDVETPNIEFTLEELRTHLFTPCFKEYQDIHQKLVSGKLSFKEMDNIFKSYKERYEDLRSELQIMHHLGVKDNLSWVDDRVKQIEQYHQLDLAVDSAKVIKNVKECLNLSGDFGILDTLLKFAYGSTDTNHWTIDCISPQLMQTRKVLAEITEDRRSCLDMVTRRKDFITWVKEALEDINELKVFVDLASISAGENDMDVDRVACFHDAILGYAPLLYELKPESGFHELMQCLKKLWKALENDEKLPKKLEDSARHLQWLKTVKESHGSVELSSLSLASSINCNGIYLIGAPAEGKKVCPDSVLRLTLPEIHGECEEDRDYSLEELKELLNKLMLMSGKGNQQNMDVEMFSEVFDSVHRLAKSFIDLHSAGNVLFRNWESKVYCSSENEFCIIMDFKIPVIGKIEVQGNLVELLPIICKRMDFFLERWNHFMEKTRTQHYYLNYFTSEQLVFLCQQFEQADISKEALTMLSFIQHSITKHDIMQVVREHRINLLDGRMSDFSLSSDRWEVEVGTQTSLGQCHKNQKIDISSLKILLKEEKIVSKQLDLVWKYYMECMTLFLPEYIDIPTFGLSLSILVGKEGSINRKMPPNLLSGRPNLILCHHSEILPSALAIYMHSPDQELPTYDEVLLCTPETTFEQMELFLRRCLTPGYPGVKIYTALYADELTYDVGYRAEQLFQTLHSRNTLDYHLVLLCNSNKENSYIPSVFSQYKVHVVPQEPAEEVQAYLRRHYAVAKGKISAAAVFKERMRVGIVSSNRAGVGKSLYIKRLHKRLLETCSSAKLKTIRMIEPSVDESKVLQSLKPFLRADWEKKTIIFHFNITSSVQRGISEFLFKLFVLQYLVDTDGRMWKCSPYHLYVVEILEVSEFIPKKQARGVYRGLQYNFLDVFPKVNCRAPKEVLQMEMEEDSVQNSSEPGMDHEEFCSEGFQRPYQYLVQFHQGRNLDTFKYSRGSVHGTHIQCLQMLLIYCGILDPTWSELRNFAWFLNLQLKDCESSLFCNVDFVGDTLQGFKNFVVNFMILMAKDFATPSLSISDQSSGRQTFNLDEVTEEDLAPFLMRKKWETEPHPYIFFNDDHVSMTFIGFHLQLNGNGGVDAINPVNGKVIKNNVMTAQLYQGLQLQKVPFNIDFDSLCRHEKIERLCMVLGIQWPLDPDETYELTTDNVLKILAIQMRFRCGIPVIIMGETGCGKTRLIKYLCELLKNGIGTENMKLVKVHGGTTADVIFEKIREAEAIAIQNKTDYDLDTVLFFDEANTTEAVSCIKEALCDRTVEGQPLAYNSGLHIIAACNPYRKHTPQMIKRLESAGLGYRVKADDTKDKLGCIPLRQLVYRVHCLPPSMIPLIWDFGQLNNTTERKYIQQIVQRLAASIKLSTHDITLLADVLSASQSYMRQRNDECSFVSLRDVERCVEVFKWFHKHSGLLLNNLERYLENSKNAKQAMPNDIVSWSLVLAIGVCYHASLEKKSEYRKVICKLLSGKYAEEKTVLQEITIMQDLFLSGARLQETIARNLALKENVFMMVICIELKIPLFLVGKPGSSKSLAKTIVADAMQGQAAHDHLYRELKQIHLVSFQCSPHSTPEGIIGTFRHCARFQKGKNLKEYVSVVVLDEIGLAEDSPKMPLKTLHPLLEDGCINGNPSPHKKVGFIGISNWALDPAKMNRGIFVSRGDPDNRELIVSANGICCSEERIHQMIKHVFPLLAGAYRKICNTQEKQEKGFFGLRDYYSLIKMIFASTKSSQKAPTAPEIVQAVLRNFSGKEDIDVLSIFKTIMKLEMSPVDVNTIELVQQNIHSNDGECRYLLVLTKNYAALQILQQTFFTDGQQPEIIFGSSFPKDQEYTQICRNINRVKICMETGQMVILLNLQNLYESLYDALNQYYVYLAGQKYVDLGLGTHRVKCRVHTHFRLIVIEEKEVVYKQFPIPLINRLEKHYIDINTVISKEQRTIVKNLEKWVEKFATVDTDYIFRGQQMYCPSDVFVGYHSDTCASIVLQVTKNLKLSNSNEDEYLANLFDEAKMILLNCATPDSVIRLSCSKLDTFMAGNLAQEYFKNQRHNSLGDFLSAHIRMGSDCHTLFTEITTFSRLLTSADTNNFPSEIVDRMQRIEVLSLQQFDTEHSFLKEIRNFFESSAGSKILIIQTDFEDGSQSAQFIASVKYSAVNEINKISLQDSQVFVYFITKLPRMEGESSYVGFHGGLWQSVHIDDLRQSKDMVSDVTALQHLKISQLFCTNKKNDEPEPMDIDSKVNVNTEPEVETETLMEEEHNPEVEMQSEAADDLITINERMQSAELEVKAGLENENECEMDIDTEMHQRTESVTVDDERSTRPQTERQPSETVGGNILDTTTLIRSCVQSAVGMLRDENEAPARSTRRIEVLLNLLSSDDELRALFLEKMKERLYELLKKQEENSLNSSEWVVREASNPDALHEAGTFRHTLWRRVQAMVTPFLAYIVSVIDRDRNLELLFNTETCPAVKKVWMFIFSDFKLLSIPYTVTGSSSQSETILVQNYMKLPESTRNTMPFSWRIKDYLDELYSHAQYISTGEGAEKFVDIFIQTPLGKFMSDLKESDREELFLRYVGDFLLLNMSISSLYELQFLQMALLSCIAELKDSLLRNEELVMCLPWVHIAYHEFMHRLQNFSRILAVNPDVLESLTMRIEEVEAMTRCEMALDVFAAVACIEMLESHVLKPSPPLWLRLVKNLQMPIEVICTGHNLQARSERCSQWLKQVRMGWNRIFSVALFVEHILLGVEKQCPELLNLVKEHTIMLGKCLQRDSDVKAARPFTAVIEVLHKCRDAAGSVFSRFGLKVCPICLGDPEEPVGLPCDHMYCNSCIKQWLNTGQMNCPVCKTDLPGDYNVTVSKELSAAIKKNAWFRGLCNSFFMDLVSTLCFKDNIPPEPEVILQLLSLLFLNKELCNAICANQTTRTKSLSPFDDSVDKNPIIRSVILKLLLKYSFENVKEYIQKYLLSLQERDILAEEDKKEMYALFVNCLEDSLYEKIRSSSAADKLSQLKNEGCFLDRFLQLKCQDTCQESSIEYLQAIARIRFSLDSAAELLFHLRSDKELTNRNEKQQFLEHMKKFCKHVGNDWFRVYLVRKLTNQYGMEFIQKLSNDGRFNWVFPPEILAQQRDQTRQIDLFLVCGEGYRILRDALGTAIIECKIKGITEAQKECRTPNTEQAVHLLLALVREVTSLYGSKDTNLHPKPAQCEAVNRYIKKSTVLTTPLLKKFASSLVDNSHPLLAIRPGYSSFRSTFIEMLVHTAAVLHCGQNRILEPLKNLAFDPAIMQNSFFPTMPGDLLVDARGWQGLAGLHWYQCPNGHYCMVGECGRPMQVSRCPDCGVAIGGNNHQPTPGFQMIQQFEDRTKMGHILGEARSREGVVAPDRSITPLAFILLRLFTHLAMRLGAEHDLQAVLGSIKPPVQDARAFLEQHVQKDLDQLRKTLGKSADETTMVVHLILCSLMKEPYQRQNQWPVGFDGTLSTKASRNAWETVVATTVIAPEIQDLEKHLLEVNTRISQDKRISSNPVVKIVYGDPKTFLSGLSTESHLHCSKIWSCRKRISIEYLGHVAQQKDGKDTVPILWKFLQKDAELRLVKFLPEILALQRDLVKKFQNGTDVDFKTINEFLNIVRSEGMRNIYKRRIEKFLVAWNQLRPSLETNGEIKLPPDSCSTILTMESAIEILLPRRRGQGLCATALVSYLISLHNDFVYTVEKHTKETRKYSISPLEVSDLHVISYEFEKDLIPIILSNCQYSVESGGEILQEFDLEKIQRQVTSRFLQGKPIISLKGIPTLVCKQDRNYENMFADIMNKLQQDILSSSMINTISAELHSYSDVCEALSVTEVTLGFLATAGGEADQPLIQYVEEVLQMGDQTNAHVLEALSRCHLKHTIALWQLLSARKSEQLIRLKRDPFSEVREEYKVKLTKDNVRHLNVFLNQASLDTFLLELHEMILLKLKHARSVEDFNPSWSLRDTLGPYVDMRKVEPYLELEELFPEEIALSQCVEAWKAAATLKRDRLR